MTYSTIIIPQPNDRAKIKAVIKDIGDCMVMIKAKQDYIKEAKASLKEEYELTPKAITTLIKLHHNDSAEEHFAEQSDLETLYSAVFEAPVSAENSVDNI